MRLNSARDLKNEITADPRWRAARAEKGVHMAIGVALGDHPDAYGIAVRAPDPESVDQALLADITAKANGEVDLQYTGPLEIVPVRGPVPVRRLQIGASIGHYNVSAGSLGFFARGTGGEIGIVSNNHVLADQDRGRHDDEILHPAADDHGSAPNDVVAYLDGSYPRLRTEGQTVDCAFARLASGITDYAKPKLSSTIVVPERFMEVEKIGRTTKRTSGRIIAAEINFIDVRYSFGYWPLHDQIEIESSSSAPFCGRGDSGSLVFTRDREPVGLLFMGTRTGHGFANPIADVLRSLRVTFA